MLFIKCPACDKSNFNFNFLKLESNNSAPISINLDKEFKTNYKFNCKNCHECITVLINPLDNKKIIIWLNYELRKEILLKKISVLRKKLKKHKIKNTSLLIEITHLNEKLTNLKFHMKASIKIKTQISF